MIKILYLIEDVRMRGAAHSIVTMLIDNLDEIEPIVIVPMAGRIVDYLESYGIKSYSIKYPTDICIASEITKEKAEENYIHSYESAKKIAECAQREGVKLIHINSSNNIVGAIAAIICGIPYVWSLREITQESSDSDYYDINLKTLLLKNANRLIGVSDFTCKCFSDRYGVNCERIYDGFDMAKCVHAIKASYNHSFAVVGYIYRYKGQYDAVRAIETIKEQKNFSDVKLEIFGEGDKDYLRLKAYVDDKGLSNSVSFHGYVNDLYNMREEIAYALVCSKMETLSRVVIEAMAAGQIVIGAGEGGIKEILGEEEDRGFIYSRGNHKELVDVIERALRLPDAKKIEIATNAQRYVIEHFDIKDTSRQFKELYSQVLAEHFDTDRGLSDYLEQKYQSILLSFKKYNLSSPKNYVYQGSIMEKIKTDAFSETLVDYFSREGIRKTAIYGFGKIGSYVYHLLIENAIGVSFIIDKDEYIIGDYLNFYHPDDEFEYVESILICVAGSTDLIVEKLRLKAPESRIISIGTILKNV